VRSREFTVSEEVKHPLFAHFYARAAPQFEAKGAAEHRRELLAGLSGRIIEVGAGTGLNFDHYPAAVTDVVAVEPEPYLREAAERAAHTAEIPVRVVDGTASRLPASDGEFDAAVASLVLCSVADPAAALAEVKRVLRVGGELRFYEHVRSSDPRLARAQRALDLIWPHLGGGCHTSRDTEQAIVDAGFTIDRVRRFTFRPALLSAPVAPHMIGVATAPSPS
jgi:ubiquinone/menaquinone biosynthesis C-methylase UbiE